MTTNPIDEAYPLINAGQLTGSSLVAIVGPNQAYGLFIPATQFIGGGGGSETNVTSSPYTVASSDVFLLCNVAGALTINLPLASSRTARLTIKDISGAANINNITIVRAGADLIDGATSDVISIAYGARTYIPITNGWAII